VAAALPAAVAGVVGLWPTAAGDPAEDHPPATTTYIPTGADSQERQRLNDPNLNLNAKVCTPFFATRSQLQSKFKHAADFGIGGNPNTQTLADFQAALAQHVYSPNTMQIPGTFHQEPVIHYVDPTTGLDVIVDSLGNVISGWRLNPSQLQNVLTRGSLSSLGSCKSTCRSWNGSCLLKSMRPVLRDCTCKHSKRTGVYSLTAFSQF
jgi:Colicin D